VPERGTNRKEETREKEEEAMAIILRGKAARPSLKGWGGALRRGKGKKGEEREASGGRLGEIEFEPQSTHRLSASCRVSLRKILGGGKVYRPNLMREDSTTNDIK